MSFRLVPKSMTLNDLERHNNGVKAVVISLNSVVCGVEITSGITIIFRTQYTLWRYRHGHTAIADHSAFSAWVFTCQH